MARPKLQHDNQFTKTYLHAKGLAELALPGGPSLSNWLDDILTGAGRLCESANNNTKAVSPYVILVQLLTHDVITVEAVRRSISRKRLAIDGVLVSERYARYVTNVVISASKSVEFHSQKEAA